MFCTKCGQQVADGAKFCVYCGNDLRSLAVEKPVAVTEPVPAPAVEEVPVDAPNPTMAPDWAMPVPVVEETPAVEEPAAVTEPVPAPAVEEVPVDAPNTTMAPMGWVAAPVVEETPAAEEPVAVTEPVPAPAVEEVAVDDAAPTMIPDWWKPAATDIPVVDVEPAVEETPVAEEPVAVTEPVPAPAVEEVPVDAPNPTMAPDWVAPVAVEVPAVEEAPAAVEEPAPAVVPAPVPAEMPKKAKKEKPEKKGGAAKVWCIILAVLVVLLIGGMVGEGCYFNGQLEATKTELADMTAANDVLAGENQNLLNELAANATTIADLEAQIAALEEALAANETTAAGQGEQIAALEAELEELRKQLDTAMQGQEKLMAIVAETAFFCEADGGEFLHAFQCPVVQESGEVLCMSMLVLEELGLIENVQICPQCH